MRAELVDELTRVFAVLEMHDPSAFTFAGRHYPIDQSAGRALDSDPLISLLQSCLYENAYSRRFTGVLAAPAAAPPQKDMSPVLAMANTSRERWVSDWRVTQLLPSGQIAAQRYDVNRLFWPGEFISAEGAGGALRPGSGIIVLCKRDAAALQPGFYFAYGEAISDQMEENPLVRFYLDVRPAGAQLAVQLFSAAFNRFRVPFRFKCLSNSGLYPRADAAVLYVARRYCRVCGELLGELHPRLSPELDADVPLFCLRLARGLSFAEDPGTGESFGMSRCRLVAEGVWDAFRQGTQLPDSRLAAVEAKFNGAGLTLDRPYLSPRIDRQLFMAEMVNQPGTKSFSADFLEAAWRLGARLGTSALWDGDRCNWLGSSMEFIGQNWLVAERTFGPDLYAGTSGIALFLAHLNARAADRIHRHTAMGALRQAWSRRETMAITTRGSFYSGWLGIAYARLEAGRLLDDDQLVESALAAVESLMECPVSPQSVDVVSGSAGAIPVLLEIHRRYPRDWLIELALRHAENLLTTARKHDDGWSWRTLEITTRDNLTGFSHGAAGIAAALLEINRVAADARFRTAAENAFRYERKWFDPMQKNWADLRVFDSAPVRPELPPPCSLAWCHGAPGIALSRLRAYELLGEPSRRTEAEAAVAATSLSLGQMLASGQGNYSLCHGQAGNAEALLYAAEIIDPSQRALAEAVGRAGIARYEQLDRPWPCGVLNGGETPGLMLGLAGIGYFYLRLHDPVRTPSVMMIRPPMRGVDSPNSVPGDLPALDAAG